MNRRNYLKGLGALVTTSVAATTNAAATDNNSSETNDEDEFAWSELDVKWNGTINSNRQLHGARVDEWDPTTGEYEPTPYQFTSDVDYAYHDPTGDIFLNIETTTPVDIGGIGVVDVSTFDYNRTTSLVVIVSADDPVMELPSENDEEFTTDTTVKVTDYDYSPSEIDNIQLRFDAFTPNVWPIQRKVPFNDRRTAIDYTNENRRVERNSVTEAVDDYYAGEIQRQTLDTVITHGRTHTDILLSEPETQCK